MILPNRPQPSKQTKAPIHRRVIQTTRYHRQASVHRQGQFSRVPQFKDPVPQLFRILQVPQVLRQLPIPRQLQVLHIPQARKFHRQSRLHQVQRTPPRRIIEFRLRAFRHLRHKRRNRNRPQLQSHLMPTVSQQLPMFTTAFAKTKKPYS